MSSHLHDLVFRLLVPESIREDPAMSAAAEAVSPLLQTVAKAVPNLLLYGRLEGQDPAGMLGPMRRLAEARGGLKTLSTEELEQLAWQWHVDFRETADTDELLRARVLGSIPWHRIKGTPKALLDALALYGIEAEIEEDGEGSHWASYQLRLRNVETMDGVRKAALIAQEMQPARCLLYRVWDEFWDVRPIRASDGPRLSEGWLSYYSGAPIAYENRNGEDVVAAVGGRARLGNAMPDFPAWCMQETAMVLRAMREHGWRLSYFRLSDAREEVVAYAAFFGNLVLGAEAHERLLTPMAVSSFSKIRMVLSDSGPLGSLNGTCLGPVRARATRNPWALGTLELSETDPETEEFTVHEHFLQTASAGNAGRAHAGSGAVISDSISGADVSRQAELSEWPADSSSRRWWPRAGFVITTSEE